MEFERWLETSGLGKYAKQFSANDIDFDVVSQLTERDLDVLGLSVGAKRRLALAVQSLDEADISTESARPLQATFAERRQLTVLFCDMVGFTELAHRLDPEVLHKIIRIYEDTCAAAITRYEGYVFQRLGDGIVAFFGYPLAHEGEAERAIHAGLDIIDALSGLDVPDAGHLDVRIGVATGLVVVSSAEKGAVGETMNLASRLQGIASVNTMVVSERVQRLAGGAFEYEDLGELNLKGIVRPTHALRVLGPGDAASRFDAATQKGLTPMVGREQEFRLLTECWQRAQGGEGQAVVLSGEPGIGKSRILSALRERLEAAGVQSIRLQCSPYYVNSALWPSIDHLERALNFARDETPESKLDKLETLVVDRRGRPRSDVRFVADLLSIPCEERYGPLAMTPQKRKDETLRTLVDLSEAAARQQPSVMLYEDVHWADPTTLEAIALLIDRLKDFPLLIVFTHRPEFRSRWSDHGHVVSMGLSKFTRTQSTALVSSVASGKALPDDLLEQILARTDGVPLFVEELTKSIIESGELKDAGDRYDYAGNTRAVTIPATLRDSLMARLDRHMPVKEIAQIGATIGRKFSYELIAAVSPIRQAKLDEALDQLTESGLAFCKGTRPDVTYTFKHALVRDAAYDSLLKTRRQELHGKIARVIAERFPESRDTEPELLAHHLSAARDAEAAIPLWKKAGELALKRMALNEAISHLNHGLELVATRPHSSERDASELPLRTALGTALVALKGWPAADVAANFSRALPLAKSLGRNDAMVHILWGLRTNVMSQGRVAESLSWAQEMLDMAKLTGDVDLLIAGHASASVCALSLGRLDDVIEHGDKVQAVYDPAQHRHLVNLLNQDPKTSTSISVSLSYWMMGYPDRAVELYDETITHARRLGHPFNLGYALSQGAALFNLRREHDEQRRSAQECERLGRDNSIPVLFKLLAPTHLGVTAIREGHIAEGITMMKEGLANWGASGGKVSVHGWAILAEAMALTGDLDNAMKLIDDSITQVKRPGWEERLHYAEILRVKGWLLELKDDHLGAEVNYNASLDCAREQQAKSWELRTATSLARLWQHQGRREQAHELLAPVYNWFTEGLDTKDLTEAKALLGELA
jgi:class 3 adenylate cyclase/tetratricopeptide (TPR) repeat protein